MAALELAAKVNGLEAEDLKPWRLKAHYQAYDPRGKPATQGTFEFFWAAKDRYRVSYTSDTFTQTYYVTPNGTFRSGSDAPVPYAESMIRGELLDPLGRRKEGPPPTLRPRKSGSVPLTCFDSHSSDSPFRDEYCFDEGKPILRSKGMDGYGTIYNKITLFQHHFLASKLNLTDGAEPVIELNIDQLRGMTPEDAQAMVPPGDAARLPAKAVGSGTVSISSRVLAGSIAHKEPPRYPPSAKQRRVQGTVRIAATISKDGLVLNQHVIHDPDSELSSAALEAVSKWRYKPYLLNGQPVEVQTVIRVTFSLGG